VDLCVRTLVRLLRGWIIGLAVTRIGCVLATQPASAAHGRQAKRAYAEHAAPDEAKIDRVGTHIAQQQLELAQDALVDG
jgi:hypothetical protein